MFTGAALSYPLVGNDNVNDNLTFFQASRDRYVIYSIKLGNFGYLD